MILRWINILLVLITFLCYLSPYIHPEYFSWLNILSTGYPALVILHLLFIGWWVFRKKKYWWYSVAAIIAGAMYLGHFIGIHPGNKNSTGQALRIASFNVADFYNPASEKKVQPADFDRCIREISADILCLQEFALKQKTCNLHLQQYASLQAYPYHFWQKGMNSIILSKYPIRKGIRMDISSNGNGCIYTDIQVNDKTIRIYTTHLQSNKITLEANDLIEEGEIDDRHTWRQARSIVNRVRNVSAVRAEQSIVIAEDRRKCPYPAIICGDFNEAPLSYAYNTLSKGMTDAFCSSGKGIGFTYAGKIPMLTIDYILLSNKINPGTCFVKHTRLSDHYPLVADIFLL
jgi:endonuclease/exonuclease/phosphatase family metal-dependent hydrolase